MPTYTMPFAIDSSAQGIPTGDGGRGVGWNVVGDTDYGRAVLTASDGRSILNQIVGVQKPRIRFWANWLNVAELTGLVGATGSIYSVTPIALHRRQGVSLVDTAPVPVIATIENPAGANLTTIWSFDLLSTTYVTTTGPAYTAAPDGTPWTGAALLTTEFSLQLIDVNGGFHPYASQYEVDWFYLSIDYAGAPSPFPTAAGGGQACASELTPSAVSAGHGCVT